MFQLKFWFVRCKVKLLTFKMFKISICVLILVINGAFGDTILEETLDNMRSQMGVPGISSSSRPSGSAYHLPGSKYTAEHDFVDPSIYTENKGTVLDALDSEVSMMRQYNTPILYHHSDQPSASSKLPSLPPIPSIPSSSSYQSQGDLESDLRLPSLNLPSTDPNEGVRNVLDYARKLSNLPSVDQPLRNTLDREAVIPDKTLNDVLNREQSMFNTPYQAPRSIASHSSTNNDDIMNDVIANMKLPGL